MSLDELRGALRGPQGVKSRIAELKSRMGVPSDFAKTLDAKSATRTSGSSLRGSLPGTSPLSGEITGSGTTPMNPFAGIMSPSMGETQLRALADSVARREGVSSKLLSAVVEAEIRMGSDLAFEGRCARTDAAYAGYGARDGVTQPLDPEQSLIGGARYLKKMLARFGGNAELAVAAYNAGPAPVEAANGVPKFAETQAYVKRVMARYGGR